MSDERERVYFPINEYGWILLFEKLHTVTMRATSIKLKTKNKKISDDSGDRCDEAEAKGGVKVKSKCYNTSDLFNQK